MQILRHALTTATLALLLAGCDKPAPAPPPPSPTPVTTAPATNAPSATAPADFAKLKGRWRRPDGGYIIEVKDILPTGKLTAAYFNPRPINVSQAEARKEAGALKVFLELRDQNYPGATYKLTYDPEHDVLAGEYYQPLAGETFQVQFARLQAEGN